jgi:serine/threonine protein kinase
LATYTHHDQLHLVFPWADGDLHDFWFKHFPGTVQPERTPQLAKWLSRQFFGLATALQGIHNSDVDESSLHNLSPRVRQQRHGRHGDIKPENILWFQDDVTAKDSYGILKLCDLGSADFHGPNSKSVRISAIHEFTGTYRAPEFDAIQRVSPQYDIWSFGCVLLQFMVWYLDGWQGVDGFTERRSKEGVSNRLIILDNFFNIISKGDTWAVQAKQSVRDVCSDFPLSCNAVAATNQDQEFALLREHSNCTDFVLDVLQLIQSSMLRMAPAKRAGCDDIVRQLEAIARRCDQDAGYCIQRSIRPIRKTSSDLSEIVPVTYSDKMKVELASIDACNPQASVPKGDERSLIDPTRLHSQDANAEISTIHTTTSVDERTAVQTPDDRSVSGLAKPLSKDHTQERESETSATGPTKWKIGVWLQALLNICFGCLRR